MDENVKKGIDIIKEHLDNFAQNGKKTFFCPNCAHKNVCKKIDEVSEQCADFSSATTYQRYSSIYHLFQPIFDWIKFHYPAGEVKFIVDHNSARMVIEHGPFVTSKEFQGSIDFSAYVKEKEQEKPTEQKE